MPVPVKICGLTRPEAVAAAVAGGAAFVGFVFYPRSPRAVMPEVAGQLAAAVPKGVTKVGLFVDADDATIARVLAAVPLDLLQLHGHETPERVAAIRARFGVPVMKVLPVAEPGDVEAADRYAPAVDRLMFDSRPPRRPDALPGGNGLPFDWRLMAGRRWPVPWMLAGGLTPENVAEAVRLTGAEAVDVSSGVEDAPGVKNVGKIAAFLAAARAA
ncbi:phosphoribosylanthranilate isomerase [Stella sp.]|uniref:phosphoribosylanthranilate isomerase n=1 Tax=Stella sp. TaxID=2912054 RepID=UPI0035B056B5